MGLVVIGIRTFYTSSFPCDTEQGDPFGDTISRISKLLLQIRTLVRLLLAKPLYRMELDQ